MDVERLKQHLERLPKVANLRYHVGRNVRSQGVQLTVTYSGQKTRFRVQARQSLTTTGVNLLASNVSVEDRKALLIYAPSISLACAKRLQHHGINFIDDLGHVFLHCAGLYLFVAGGKERQTFGQISPQSKTHAVRPFRTATLKFIYAVLADPQLDSDDEDRLLNGTYRVMSQRMGLSLGSIKSVLDDLSAEAFVIEVDSRHRLLADRKRLFERWVNDFGARLRPKLITGRYSTKTNRWWEAADIRDWGGCWGGEVAASKLTGYLQPETATLYADSLPQSFIVQQDLHVDPIGSVEILKPFWKEIAVESDCVHPLVAYADLIASNIDRNLEAAEKIYERYLRPIIESD